MQKISSSELIINADIIYRKPHVGSGFDAPRSRSLIGTLFGYEW